MPLIASLLLSLAVALTAAACRRPNPPPAEVAPPAAALAAQAEQFRQGLSEVVPGVWLALGYGIGSVIFLEGPEGVVVVDSMESIEAASAVLAAFRERSDKPLVALIYTHSHPDHIGGAAVFAEAAGRALPIYAHADLLRQMQETSLDLQPVITRRSLRMYGAALPESQRTHLGIGPFLALGAESRVHTLAPTVTFQDVLEVRLAGLELRLMHAPGETDDQLAVWLPETRVLLVADNFYQAFPNLYTLRGTRYRDPRQWADTLDRLRALKPAVLVPSHTRPILGEEQVETALRDYRDAIRYVHDQTLRRINRGETPEQIAASLRLPEPLAGSPWLQEFYGTPQWAARSIYAGLLGWFDGNASRLRPLPPEESARRWIALAGGREVLLKAAERALAEDDPQWALEISDPLLAAAPGEPRAAELRARALRALAAGETNPNARHWYLTQAAETTGQLRLPERIVAPTPEMLAGIPIARFLDALAVNLDPAQSAGQTRVLGFHFTESDTRYTYTVRNDTSEITEGLTETVPTVVAIADQTFKEMLAQLRSPTRTLLTEARMVRGSRLDFLRFMRQFVAVDAEALEAGR